MNSEGARRAFHEHTYMLHSQATCIGYHELSQAKVHSPTDVPPQPQQIFQAMIDHIVFFNRSILLFPLPFEGRLIIG
jgi:hypothetical protein